jgi:hypothetical protein
MNLSATILTTWAIMAVLALAAGWCSVAPILAPICAHFGTR